MEANIWGQLLENYQQVNSTYIGDILISEEDNHLHPKQIVKLTSYICLTIILSSAYSAH